MEDTIFVSIASFRDSDCKNTLKSLFQNATHKERVFVGTCEQNHPDKTEEMCELGTPEGSGADIPPHHVRRMVLHDKDARGPTFARYLCTTLWQGEKYFLQLDSHMRLVPGWDEKVVSMLKNVQQRRGKSKIVLSTYVNGVESYDGYLKGDEEIRKRSPRMCQAFFNQQGMVSFHGANILDNTPEPFEVPFVAGGFIFCEAADFMREVPQDPYLDDVFVGEEILLSARLWTSGFDIFTPNENIAFHKFTREGEPKFWENERDDDQGSQRVRYLLGLDTKKPQVAKKYLDRFGMGKERTLDEFWAFAGIDPKNKKVTKNFCGGPLIPEPHDGWRPSLKRKKGIFTIVILLLFAVLLLAAAGAYIRTR